MMIHKTHSDDGEDFDLLRWAALHTDSSLKSNQMILMRPLDMKKRLFENQALIITAESGCSDALVNVSGEEQENQIEMLQVVNSINSSPP